MSSKEIYNHLKVSEDILTAGQPTAEQLRAAATEGVVNVINLATDNPPHLPEDEAGLVRALGLNYFHIPVAWDNPKESDFAAFEATLASLPPGKTLIHCAANFRVTAFYSLYAQKHLVGRRPRQKSSAPPFGRAATIRCGRRSSPGCGEGLRRVRRAAPPISSRTASPGQSSRRQPAQNN
ncbi:MAG: protein tyrosine phosphatase family protein [Anaerolineales bacterium]|nr:protein tyrosine phosphatase family protein [Anaerolineales bacterium]